MASGFILGSLSRESFPQEAMLTQGHPGDLTLLDVGCDTVWNQSHFHCGGAREEPPGPLCAHRAPGHALRGRSPGQRPFMRLFRGLSCEGILDGRIYYCYIADDLLIFWWDQRKTSLILSKLIMGRKIKSNFWVLWKCWEFYIKEDKCLWIDN